MQLGEELRGVRRVSEQRFWVSSVTFSAYVYDFLLGFGTCSVPMEHHAKRRRRSTIARSSLAKGTRHQDRFFDRVVMNKRHERLKAKLLKPQTGWSVESNFQTFCGLCAFEWLAGRHSVQWSARWNVLTALSFVGNVYWGYRIRISRSLFGFWYVDAPLFRHFNLVCNRNELFATL